MSTVRQSLSLKPGTSVPEPIIIQIPRDFLRRYLKRRDPQWDKPDQTVKDSVNHLTERLFFGYKPFQDIPKERKDLSEELMTLLRTTVESGNIDRWCALITRLANEALIAQKATTVSSNSLFFDTLHAIRSFLVSSIRKDERLNAKYNQKIDELLAAWLTLDQQILVQSQQGNVVNNLKKQRNDILSLLANLEHETSIFKATDYGLLDCKLSIQGVRLPNRNETNPNKPLHLQKDFHISYYESEIRSQPGGNKRIPFDAYVANGIYHLAEVEVIDADKKLAESEAAAAANHRDSDGEQHDDADVDFVTEDGPPARSAPQAPTHGVGLFDQQQQMRSGRQARASVDETEDYDQQRSNSEF